MSHCWILWSSSRQVTDCDVWLQRLTITIHWNRSARDTVVEFAVCGARKSEETTTVGHEATIRSIRPAVAATEGEQRDNLLPLFLGRRSHSVVTTHRSLSDETQQATTPQRPRTAAQPPPPSGMLSSGTSRSRASRSSRRQPHVRLYGVGDQSQRSTIHQHFDPASFRSMCAGLAVAPDPGR